MGVLDGYDSGRAAPVNNGGFTRSSSMGGNQSQYNTIGEVVSAYNNNKINYQQAYTILSRQFALSDNDIYDVLIAENKPPNPPLPPGTPDDSEEEEEIPDTSTDTTDTESVGLTDDQRFMVIGLVVLGGILGFIKR